MGIAADLAKKLMSTSSDTAVRDMVLDLLKDPENAEYKDNDAALCAHVWYLEFGDQKTNSTTAFEFLKYYGTGKLSAPDKIISVKQQLQDLHKDLRGEHYEPKRTKTTLPQGSNKKRLGKGNRPSHTEDDSE